MEKEMLRLDRFLAEAGCGTRSEVKNKIRSGQVSVAGRIVKDPGLRVEKGDPTVLAAGRVVSPPSHAYYMLNKPAGVVSATRDALHDTVVSLLSREGRSDLFPVGRLDLDTTGLMLLTDDGALAHRLLSPARHVEKEYEAVVTGQVEEKTVQAFEKGLDIGEKKPTLPATLVVCESGLRQEGEVCTRVRVTLREGKFHQIKRMFLCCGHQVISLRRIRMGEVTLDETLPEGAYRALTEQEIRALKRQAGME